MEHWRRVWREGFAPQFSDEQLKSLRAALLADDRRLIQGDTCSPPALQALSEVPVEAACAVAWCGWQGEGDATVGEVEFDFSFACDACDAAMREPLACRYFLNWYDMAPRGEMRRLLAEEIGLALSLRRPASLQPALARNP